MTWAILDCTLRDGGYYTQWDFDDRLVAEYVNTIRDLPVSYIEIGYRNPPQTGYAGKYYYVSVTLLEQLISSGIDSSRLGVMLDAKLVKPSDIATLLASCRGRLGVVRLAVQPSQVDVGLNLAAEIKNLGFKVGINLMYMHDQPNLMKAVVEIERRADALDWVSLVDSFGACYPKQVGDSIKKVKSIIHHKIGFHGHDNLHLAFANALAAIAAGADIIDSTILGMGRGAGNLKTELLLTYWSELSGDRLDLSDLGSLLEIFQKQLGHHDWGTSLPYMISGVEALPQKDVMQWIGMRRYSTPTIISKLRAELSQKSDSRSLSKLKSLSSIAGSDQACLILGGGATVVQHANALKEFASYKECIVIHSSLKSISVFSGVDVKQFVCLPGDEFRHLDRQDDSVLSQLDGFVVSQTFNGSDRPQYVYYEKTFGLTGGELEFIKGNLDTPLSIALGAALDLSLSEEFYLAGFDGYSHKNVIDHEIELETQLIMNEFRNHYPKFVLSSITPTSYNIDELSVYALLQPMIGLSG
jgi:4-hydroxy 2-oxovalerate aldolase